MDTIRFALAVEVDERIFTEPVELTVISVLSLAEVWLVTIVILVIQEAKEKILDFSAKNAIKDSEIGWVAVSKGSELEVINSKKEEINPCWLKNLANLNFWEKRVNS